MYETIIILPAFSTVIFGSVHAQRKVLLEEFTGANCSNCPMGSYFVDSMTGMHPDVIAVSLHSYPLHDSMFFPVIDTIGQAYAGGAPLAAIDRIPHTPTTAVFQTQWHTNIQQRLVAAPGVSITTTATWDGATRDISITMQVSILSDLDAGDYRMNLYVMEDSVIGTGNGYDQANIYNTTAGNPFFGKGDPILGFVHRHVVRAIVPAEWGLSGVFPTTPIAGQNYAHIFHYTLPANYDEHKVSLVTFVSAYTADHLGDSVLNAAEQKLFIINTSVTGYKTGNFSIYPNPSHNIITFSSASSKEYTLYLYNGLGQLVLKRDFKGSFDVTKADVKYSGMYFSRIMQGRELVVAKTVTFLD